MKFTNAEILEFRSEAEELLSEAEQCLLRVERGEEFKHNYDSIFRSFHSLKGAAGMLELTTLQEHMHKVENLFQQYRSVNEVKESVISFFLTAIDAAKNLLHSQHIEFCYELPSTDVLSKSSEKPIVDLSTPLVYIIDDEEEIVEILGVMMSKYKYRWKGFTRPEEAIEAIEVDNPSLILSDMKMPGMNGIEVLKAVRNYGADVPLIFISGHLSKEVLIETFELGISGVIEKPFKESQIISSVALALQQQKIWQTFNKSIDLILFQFQDVRTFLKASDKEEVANILTNEVNSLLMARRELKNMKVPIKPLSRNKN